MTTSEKVKVAAKILLKEFPGLLTADAIRIALKIVEATNE